MGKTRDLAKKTRDTQGTFHAKMSQIKDRSSNDLTEAKDIKKRWQEYTEELYKKDLHDQDYHDGVITHLEPDILACAVKWVLESITMNKASGGDGIPVELFQILEDDAVKMLHSICKEIEENNRMGITRDLFKKIGDIKGTFHARMGTIKDKNVKNVTEADKIKKRWKEYTEELY